MKKIKMIVVAKAFIKFIAVIVILPSIYIPNYTQAVGVPVVSTVLSIVSDGSTPLDAVTFDPVAGTDSGFDSSLTNGIVRNSDSVIYKMEGNLNNADSDNATFALSLKGDQIISTLPAGCLTTRSSGPLSPISSLSANRKELICNTGIQNEGTTILVNVTAKILPNTSNNSSISASNTFIADGAENSTSNQVSLITTARPLFDVAKFLASSTDTVVNLQNGKMVTWVLTGRYTAGSEAFKQGVIEITDTISNSGASNTSLLDSCGVTNFSGGLWPYGKIGTVSQAKSTNSVQDSGVVTCTQPGGAGTATIINISPDFQASAYPVEFTNGVAIAGRDNYFFSVYLKIFIPNSDLEIGFNSMSVNNNAVVTIIPLTLSDQIASETTLANNTAFYSMLVNAPTPGPLSTTIGASLYGVNAGPPSYTKLKVLAGQSFKLSASTTSFSGNYGFSQENIPKQLPNTTQINCFKFDPKLEFSGAFYNQNINFGFMADLFKGVVPEIRSGFFNYKASNITPNYDPNSSYGYVQFLQINRPSNFNYVFYTHVVPAVVEYSTTQPASLRTGTCDDLLDGPWTTTMPADPSTVRQIRKKVDFHNIERPDMPERYPENSILYTSDLSPGLKAKSSAVVGDNLGMFRSDYFPPNPVDSTSVPQWWHSIASDDPLNVGYADDPSHNGRLGAADKIVVVSAKVRSVKTIDDLNIDGTTKSVFKNTDKVNFTIASNFELPSPPPMSTTTLTLTDDLPAGVVYNNDQTQIQGSPCTFVSIPNTPSAGRTRLQWTCPSVLMNGNPLTYPKFKFSTSFADTVIKGFYTNSVISDSPIDSVSTIAERTSSVFYSVNTIGNYFVSKSVSTPAIETNEDISFKLFFANSGVTNFISTTSIDILPFNGNAKVSPLNNFTGSVAFKNITGYHGEVFAFTKAPPQTINSDPCHVSNQELGQTNTYDPVCAKLPSLIGGTTGTDTTKWCIVVAPFTDANFSSLNSNCPRSLSEVTAIKITGGIFPINQTIRKLDLTLSTSGNSKGSVYTNEFSSRASEMTLPVLSNDATASVISGSVGDRVFLDINNNGTEDLSDLPLANISVQLFAPGLDNVFGTGDDQTFTTTTDTNGMYMFDGLASGNYKIVVNTPSLPSGLVQTYDLDGMLTPNSTSVSLQRILNSNGVLTSIDNLSNVDFGYSLGLASIIGNTVFMDNDKNGEYSSNDSVLSNVEINLHGAGSDGLFNTADDTNQFAITNSDGKYLFIVSPGLYKVTPKTPKYLTPHTVYNDSLLDDISKPFGYQVNVSAGNANLTADFGFVNAQSSSGSQASNPTPTIIPVITPTPFGLNPGSNVTNTFVSGVVFFDNNKNSYISNYEKGIAGIPVEVTDSAGVTQIVFTNEHGFYSAIVTPGFVVAKVNTNHPIIKYHILTTNPTKGYYIQNFNALSGQINRAQDVGMWRKKINLIDTSSGTSSLANSAKARTKSQYRKAFTEPKVSDNSLIIESIGVNGTIHQNTNPNKVLNNGITHIPWTSTPDFNGNTVIAAHRYLWTDGPNTFFNLDKLKSGDLITIKWQGKPYSYKVNQTKVVNPNETFIEENTTKPMLTLYTCTPVFTSKQRLVVTADLVN